MGLFGMFKKEETKNRSNETEFEKDVKELLGRADIQCRQDVSAAEYKKALSLLENPTQEKIHRAYDIMGPLASEFEYIPAILWMADFAEGAKQNVDEAAFWYKKAADLGDGNGARCYADLAMTGQLGPQGQQEAFKYYGIAAENGVPEAAFVLAQFMMRSGDKQKAKELLQKAYENGYAPAKSLLEKL